MGLNGCLEDGALLDGRNARGNADNHARPWRPGVAALARLLDEVPEHDFSDIKVGDDAVLEGALGDDGARSAANHALGVGAYGKDAALALVDGDDRGLVDDDALPRNSNKGIGSAQIDGHVRGHLAGQARKPIKE